MTITPEYDELARIIEAREKEIAELRKELERYRVPCEECGGSGIKMPEPPDNYGDSFNVEHHAGKLCPACLGLGYTEIVRVPDAIIRESSKDSVYQFRIRLNTGDNKYYVYDGRWKDAHFICTLTRDPDDPAWWILTEAKE